MKLCVPTAVKPGKAIIVNPDYEWSTLENSQRVAHVGPQVVLGPGLPCSSTDIGKLCRLAYSMSVKCLELGVYLLWPHWELSLETGGLTF